MRRYAQGTKSPVEKTRNEIERVLIRYGATGFGYGWEERLVASPPKDGRPAAVVKRTVATIVFTLRKRKIRLDIPMPAPEDLSAKRKLDLAQRERWRAALLVIKAKLEAVHAEISTLEEEFLANVVTEDGRTVGEIIVPRLTEAVRAGRLLPSAGGTT